MRAFVRLRERIGAYPELVRLFESLQSRHEGKFQAVWKAIHMLMHDTTSLKENVGRKTAPPPRRRIGFTPAREGEGNES